MFGDPDSSKSTHDPREEPRAAVRHRKPQQIAERALILGALAFRASLEVTDHPRVNELSLRPLPWLGEMGCADELDPSERDLLVTPLAQLSGSQRIDANWAGEAAALFCWMLNLGEPLAEKSFADPPNLPSVLRILRTEAVEIIQSALLRDYAEIVDTCRHLVLVRSVLRESRVPPPASDIVRRLTIQELNEMGVFITGDAIRRATDVVGRMAPQERKDVAGLYFVRALAALWFLSDRTSYFG